jgi:macrolide-specific efflux system membrane fusion protein
MAKQDSLAASERDFGAQFLANRKRRRRRRLIGALVVVVAIGGGYVWMSQQGEEIVEDEALVVTIGYGDIENAIPAAGSLQPKEIVPVGARASGELIEIYVEVGDFVQEGQDLALIDPEEQRLRVESSRLSLENQRNQLAQRELAVEIARNNFERTQMLFAANASTEQELENAENALLQAQTNLRNLEISIQQSETNLEQEEVQLRYTEIRAPLTGTIISLDQKERATLNATQTAPTVMQIADLTTMTVETEISEADIAALDEGVDVYFTTLGGGDRRWYGNLRQIDPMPTTDNNVVLYNGRFDVDNSDGELYPGMTTQVFFVTSQANNVLTVPVGALTFTEPAGGGGATTGRQAAPSREDMAALREQFRAGGGEITPEMRARFEQMRASGGFSGGGGGFPGGGGFGGQGQRGGQSAGPGLAGSIALNEPRNATVEFVRPDGSTETREVVVGAMDRVNAAVISGLSAGDQVIAGIVLETVEQDADAVTSASRW